MPAHRPLLSAPLALLALACAGPDAGITALPVGGELPAVDVGMLLDGAFSDVPDEAMAPYPAIFGGSQTRHTRITGIEFHIPGVISSHGLSTVPVPLRIRRNGVDYWQVTGEMSATIVDDLGVYRVIGPIDADGVSHRDEPFDPRETEDDATFSHPRAGLPGAFFAIRWPAHGFHGGVIQNQAPADAGYAFPQAPLAWMNVDALAMLDAGYAIASVGAGTTLWGRKEADGTVTVDSNPESGSGIFWTEDYEIWPDGGVWETERTRLVPNMRAAQIDGDLSETALPADTSVTLWVPEFNEETGEFGLFIQDDFLTNPFFSWPAPAFVAPELIRDASVVFRSFLAQATGVRDLWTCYLGWSGSGIAAWILATGKQNNALVLGERALGSPPSAGNFNRWRDPASGVRFDAFVVFAGAVGWPWFSDDTDLEAALVSADVDPEYPIGAPYVLLHGDGDLVVTPLNSYVQANAVARAWPGSAMAAESIDDYLSILSLEKVNHAARDQILTTFDRPPFDGGMWWDPALGQTPESLEGSRRGLRITDEYARMQRQNGGELFYWASDIDAFPRMTPLYLGLFDRLREGRGLPTSRVDPDIFEHLDEIDIDTEFPLYDRPCDTSWETPFEELLACRDGLQDDGTMVRATALPGEIAALHEFAASNPMSRSTERLILPDVAAPLGWFYLLGGIQLRRDFTTDELRARYGTHRGWVRAFEAAGDALIADGLWDRRIGGLYLQRARASDILTPREGRSPTATSPRPAPQRAAPALRAVSGKRHGR
jgi:hypothetical protein